MIAAPGKLSSGLISSDALDRAHETKICQQCYRSCGRWRWRLRRAWHEPCRLIYTYPSRPPVPSASLAHTQPYRIDSLRSTLSSPCWVTRIFLILGGVSDSLQPRTERPPRSSQLVAAARSCSSQTLRSLTSSGGFRPHFFALSQRSKRVMPAQGPYRAVMSKTRRMSGKSVLSGGYRP